MHLIENARDRLLQLVFDVNLVDCGEPLGGDTNQRSERRAGACVEEDVVDPNKRAFGNTGSLVFDARFVHDAHLLGERIPWVFLSYHKQNITDCVSTWYLIALSRKGTEIITEHLCRILSCQT